MQNQTGQMPQAQKSLSDISAGRIADAKVQALDFSTIITATKFKNSILKAFVKSFRDKKMPEDGIVDFLVVMDECAEEGLITEEFLDAVKRDPSLLQEYLNKNITT